MIKLKNYIFIQINFLDNVLKHYFRFKIVPKENEKEFNQEHHIYSYFYIYMQSFENSKFKE